MALPGGASPIATSGVPQEQEIALGKPLLAGRAGQSARLLNSASGWSGPSAASTPADAAGGELAAQLDNELLLAVRPGCNPSSSVPIRFALFQPCGFGCGSGPMSCWNSEYLGQRQAWTGSTKENAPWPGFVPLGDLHLCQRGSVVHSPSADASSSATTNSSALPPAARVSWCRGGNPAGDQDGGRPAAVRRALRQSPGGIGDPGAVRRTARPARVPGIAIEGYGDAETTHLAVAACVAARVANCTDSASRRRRAVSSSISFRRWTGSSFSSAVSRSSKARLSRLFWRSCAQRNSVPWPTPFPAIRSPMPAKSFRSRRTLPWYK